MAATTIYKVKFKRGKSGTDNLSLFSFEVGYFNEFPCTNLRGSVGKYGKVPNLIVIPLIRDD